MNPAKKFSMRNLQFVTKKRSALSPIEEIRAYSRPLHDQADLDEFIDRATDAKVVMLGEATHGSHEFYTWRTMISKRLIQEGGFNFIAVEGDWPDCYRLNRYLKNYPQAGDSAYSVLQAFNRWPTWMWANWEIVALAEWMYEHNQSLPTSQKVGFYGLDVYSLWESLEAIMHYLQKTDPLAFAAAKEAYHCFEPYQADEGQRYAQASQFVSNSCEQEVVTLLAQVRQRMAGYNTDHENVFNAEQNALILADAEKYYRTMIRGGAYSWNIRDRHMADTLHRLLKYHGPQAKAIVWAHNTHIGDVRATIMRDQGMFNLGEIIRNELGYDQVFLAGLGTYQGQVIAAPAWGSPEHTYDVPPAMEHSWEAMLHSVHEANQVILMHHLSHPDLLNQRIRQRAIGVVYHPHREQPYNYVPSEMTNRYDAFLYFDHTKALHPLHVRADQSQMPETYPFGV